MKFLYIFAALLLLVPSALAQNCTTMPMMNTATITGNITGSSASQTLTVNLAAPGWTQGSGTGYATIYGGANNPNPSFSGSYTILSGNGTGPNGSVGATSITLDQTTRTNGGAAANGSFSGAPYVSDVAVVRDPNSVRKYTISWTTPGFNSTTNLSYGDDSDTTTGGGPGAFGYNWIHQDTTTGVQMHSVTIDNLDLTVGDNVGKYAFVPWSLCFTGGAPDPTLRASLPYNLSIPTNSFAGYDQIIQVPTNASVTPGLDTFTLQSYDGRSSAYVIIPGQDGTHIGFRVSPGQGMPLNFFIFDTVQPNASWTTIGDNGANVAVEDWYGAGTGLLLLGKNGTMGGQVSGPWTGQQISARRTSGGSNLSLTIPSNAPTTGTGCTNLMGTPLTLDDGTPACAYPLRLTATRWISSATYRCGTAITCGPPGTPALPVANVPFVAEVWAIVFNAPAVPQGTVGAWINQYTGAAGIPCERDANKAVDKPYVGIAAAGCRNQTYGIGQSGQIYTYDTNQTQNCAFNGSDNENTYTITSTPLWFYDNPYVCHTLDVLGYPPAGGQPNNDSYEKHILGIYWQQSGYPRSVETTMVGAYAVSAAATPTNNATCTAIAGTIRDPFCATLTVPVGTTDVSAIANGLAQGIRYRACINIDNPSNTSGAGSYSYGCYVFPSTQMGLGVTPTATAGGNISSPTTSVQMMIFYTASTLNVYGYPCANAPNCTITSKSVTISSTCPTSGNCSVTVPGSGMPQVTNAIGYDVYARANGTGTYYRQNTAGPVPTGTSFTFGTAINPFITSGGYVLPIGIIGGNTMNASITNVLAADNVAHTITIDTQQGLSVIPSNANNATIFIMRQLSGITADATSNASTVVCVSCDFTASDGYKGIPTWATVYCGVTPGSLGPFPNYALYTLAPNRGSQINSVDVPNHTIHLTTPINCGPGVNFEIRQEGTLAGNNRIFNWTKGSYDVWSRLGNYIGADAVLWLAQDTNPPGSNFSAPNPGASYVPARRRESALSVLSCQTALHVLNDLSNAGNTTALSPATTCQSVSTGSARVNALFSMIDTMTNGNQGRGSTIGSFLNGLVLDAVINWYIDPLMGVQSDTRYLYWAKRLVDTLWNIYYGARTSPLTACQGLQGGLYPHEYSYDPESMLLGICFSNNTQWYPNGAGIGSPAPGADYWSITGNIFPAFAFFYAWTGNAVIPNSNPPTTYGAAYQDMASWSFVHMASMASWVNTNAGLKTLGEMGIWQNQALGPTGWMSGTTTTVPPPTPLTITTSSLPAGTVGVPYVASMAATGGTAPYTWTSTGLPGGLTMNTSGNISGSPLTAGTSSPTFTATDSVSATASTSLALTIGAAPPPPLVITTNSLPSGTVGIPYSASMTATGGTPPYTWSSVGLPSGLVMNSSGNISGTPLVAGNLSPLFTVTDAATMTVSVNLTLAIAPAAAPTAAPGFTPPIISERRSGSDRIGLSN